VTRIVEPGTTLALTSISSKRASVPGYS
jgi:hypothetical protein